MERMRELSKSDIVLLREARHLLRSAFLHSDAKYHPIAESKIRKALHQIDSAFDADDVFTANASQVPLLLDRVKHAMQSTWFFSDISCHPDLGIRFDCEMRRVEARILDVEEARSGHLSDLPKSCSTTQLGSTM